MGFSFKLSTMLLERGLQSPFYVPCGPLERKNCFKLNNYDLIEDFSALLELLNVLVFFNSREALSLPIPPPTPTCRLPLVSCFPFSCHSSGTFSAVSRIHFKNSFFHLLTFFLLSTSFRHKLKFLKKKK